MNLHETWIPFTNDTRWTMPPMCLLDLDAAIGRALCRIGIHGGWARANPCWYCGGHR